jgi:ATP-binding cassette, subfamily C (CFTR/MRP), member 1
MKATQLSNATYKHHTYRMITMFRGSLATIIFSKTLGLKSSSENSVSMTLMSTDIDGIATGFENFHEIWACTIEVALGLWLLERNVGLACIAPAITALGTCRALFWHRYLIRSINVV